MQGYCENMDTVLDLKLYPGTPMKQLSTLWRYPAAKLEPMFIATKFICIPAT